MQQLVQHVGAGLLLRKEGVSSGRAPERRMHTNMSNKSQWKRLNGVRSAKAYMLHAR